MSLHCDCLFSVGQEGGGNSSICCWMLLHSIELFYCFIKQFASMMPAPTHILSYLILMEPLLSPFLPHVSRAPVPPSYLLLLPCTDLLPPTYCMNPPHSPFHLLAVSTPPVHPGPRAPVSLLFLSLWWHLNRIHHKDLLT